LYAQKPTFSRLLRLTGWQLARPQKGAKVAQADVVASLPGGITPDERWRFDDDAVGTVRADAL
jgi:hypothetical protein